MPGLVPGIHIFTAMRQAKTWMAGTSPAMTRITYRSSADRAAAVDHDALAVEVGAGLRGEKDRAAGGLVWHADPTHRRARLGGLQRLRIVPQRFRKICLDPPRRARIDPHLVPAGCDRGAAREPQAS